MVKKKNGIQFGLASGSQQRKVHSTHMTVMYIDLERNSANGARVSRSSTSSGSSFGKGASRTPIQGTVKGLPKRYKVMLVFSAIYTTFS